MAYQFVHASTYSVKTGGKGVAAEAGRKPDHCKHVDSPLPPVQLGGMSTDEAWQEIERRREAATTQVVGKDGVTRSRKLRSDQQVMLAAVASWPIPTKEQDINDPNFKSWVDKTMQFFEEKHGKALSAVMHLDETFPHIHYITAPDLESGQRMHDIHQGEKAKHELGGRAAKKTDKKKAYKDAMRDYQDEYHETVSQHYGHARKGPQRLRLTRDQWKNQQAEDARLAAQLVAIEQQHKQVGEAVKAAEVERSGLQAEMASGRARLGKRSEVLNQRRDKLKNLESSVKSKEKQIQQRLKGITKKEKAIEAFEKRSAGFWGKAVSFVTLGRKGVEKRIREAQAAARGEVGQEIDELKASLTKAKSQTNRQTKKLSASESNFQSQEKHLKTQAGKLQDLERDLSTVKQELDAARAQNRPLEADNATLKKDLRVIKIKLDGLKESLDAGDMDSLKKGLSTLTQPEVPQHLENPAPARSRNWDHSPGHG